MTKVVEGKLMIAPCQLDEIKTKFVDFGWGIINGFEIEIINGFEFEKINAELKILVHKQEAIQ